MAHARYSTVAVVLHWAIALLIIGQIAGGFYMHKLPNDASEKFALYQLHKSFGLSILGLSVIRLGWRLTHRPPSLPTAMPGWQRLAARATHFVFYGLMFITPLVGWAMVSVSPINVQTEWFGMFNVPHLPIASGADAGATEDVLKEAHEFLAFTILGLLALHISAAIKHAFIDRDYVFESISPLRIAAIVGVFAILAFLGAAAGLYLRDPAPPTASERQAMAHDHDHDRDSSDELNDNEIAPPDSVANTDDGAGDSVSTTNAGDHDAHDDHDHGDLADGGGGADLTNAPENPASPPLWRVDYSKSELRFFGEEQGAKFEGAFSDFTADVRFSPANLGQSTVVVSVQTASGATGGEIRDATMQDREWFDTRAYPVASFRTTQIRSLGGNEYEADGVLTIKDFDNPVTLRFMLETENNSARASGGANLIRTDYGLGLSSSWLDDEEIGLSVRVEFDISAERAN